MVMLSATPPAPAPVPQAAAPAPSQTTTFSAAPAPPATGDVVHGFANRVPLAVALRQILPSGYGFSIDQDVDLSVLVSFSGGKPWHETLDETLAPAGLVAHADGQMVQISYASSKLSEANSAPAVPPAAGATATLSSNMTSLTSPASPPPQPATPAAMPPQSPPVPSPSDEAALAASLPSTPLSQEQTWNAEPGETLHKVLENWSHRANVEFDWMAEYDYPLQASVHLKGSFEDAVRDLLIGFETAHPQPVAELHANTQAGQMVLVVTTRGNSSD
jgi:hypothetical protein